MAKEMSAAAREARRAYKRDWAKKHPDKIRAQQQRYWERRAQGMTPPAADPDNSSSLEAETCLAK